MEAEVSSYAQMPFHFWTVVFFVYGAMAGSFLNVCIHRMPREMSIVTPRSHCPECKHTIPALLNIPIFTWLWLGGKCKNCGAAISARYFLVEVLTGVAFMSCWLAFGDVSVGIAIVYSILFAGLIVATFIDLEHFIIPDEVTLGGIAAGFIASALVPAVHGLEKSAPAMEQSFYGILVGGGLVYAILRLGKLMFGREQIKLEPDSRIVFSETDLFLPNEVRSYGDVFYRNSDAVHFRAERLETVDRCFRDVDVELSPGRLRIADQSFDPESVHFMEARCSELVLPREAMGLGDVKFMAAIGAFLGWNAVLFSLMLSAVIGSIIGVGLILLGKREWSSRLPYGPYIALAAVVWMFARKEVLAFVLPE